ncbi:alpha/beta hydrolase family protein [Bradyrhizobium sp.]|jgi:pimeloyl-ACP methyl ester carboxylesterase|uniref:alpha/beta hydrolase family protein n=1 Tax=Bradyrhizobium sp. TaxID=376 RepID=UPI003C134B06
MRVIPHRGLIRWIVRSVALVGIYTFSDALAQTEGLSIRAPDAFYDPPAKVTGAPGTLLRSEPLEDVTLPTGMRGWRIKYTTTIDDKTPITAVATVFTPVDPPKKPRPVIIWEHGTTGLLQKCMPSLLSAPTRGIPAVDRIVKAGWVIVATDYSFAEKNGPHPYLLGEGEARAGLDSVRAARKMPELKLSDRAAVWGHSQGGQSALWTGIVGPRYAPDVKIVGVVAIAPGADMTALLSANVELDHWLGPYVASSYSRFYPDIKFEQAVRPEVFAAAREMTKLCGFLPAEDARKFAELLKTFEGPALATANNPMLAARIAQNTASKPIAAPLLIAQGMTDTIVTPAVTERYVDGRCYTGQRLEYWTFIDHDHNGIVQPGSKIEEPLINWTVARFAGERQAAGCKHKSF